MLVTHDEPTQEAFQRATQAYFDSLHPWPELGDCPTPARTLFSLLEEDHTCNEDTDHIAIRLSPEGLRLLSRLAAPATRLCPRRHVPSQVVVELRRGRGYFATTSS
jgi:hypothetical protein